MNSYFRPNICSLLLLSCSRTSLYTPLFDFKTASIIATSIVHSKLDYCNSLYYDLPQSEIKRLRNIQHSLARAVCRTPKSSHITPVLKSLHWLRINERIQYKLLFLTYKVLTTNQAQYVHNLISIQRCHNKRSSSMATLARPPTRSLKITNRSFQYAAPYLSNQLPTELREIPVRYCVLHVHLLSHMAVHLHHLHYHHFHYLSHNYSMEDGISAHSEMVCCQQA